jgi:hypothetical protein
MPISPTYAKPWDGDFEVFEVFTFSSHLGRLRFGSNYDFN